MDKPNLDEIFDRVDEIIAEAEAKEGRAWLTDQADKARAHFLRELLSRAEGTLGVLEFKLEGETLFSCYHAPAGFVFSGRDGVYVVDPYLPRDKKVVDLIDQILTRTDWEFEMHSLSREAAERLAGGIKD